MVGSDGRVRDPIVPVLHVRPVGNARGEPQGYRGAIIAAVGEWTYPASAHACRAGVSLRIAFE